MRILFIHQNFPAQFKYLAPALVNLGHQVYALAINGSTVPGVKLIKYSPTRSSSTNIHPLAVDFESKVIRAEACANAMLNVKKTGFEPDIIIIHSGWGESLLAKEVFPEVPQLHYLEYYYNTAGGDVGFDREFDHNTFLSKSRSAIKNASLLMALQQMDWGVAPTFWQKSLFPKIFQEKIEVIFDGVDTNRVAPLKDQKITPIKIINRDGNTFELKEGQEVLTFISRNLEPYRGYHTFMRALPEIQRQRPNAKIIIVGGDGVTYGQSAPQGQSWKSIFYDEVKEKINPANIFYLGSIPYDVYLNILRVSCCHVYLTYPFVLSWSCVEAMSMGCVIVGSRTSPVEELISDKINGLLVNFFDAEELAKTVIDVLSNPNKYNELKIAARKTVINKYDLESVSLPRQIDLVGRIAKLRNGSLE
jgi:glycosyltransferase involved in cell wall biosynthesis